MRPTVFALLILCCGLSTGCESLNRLARKPGTTPAGSTDKLAQDAKRRQATEDQATGSPSAEILARQSPKSRQANFPPASATANGSVDSLLAQASQAERANQNPAAKTLYEQVLQSSPQNAQAHHRLGVLADRDGNYPEAQNHYQAALAQDPGNSVLLSDIGYSFYSQDRLDEAEQYLQESLRIQPNNEIAHNNLAQVYGRRAQQTGSQADYQLARDQFSMATGPQGADEQMQKLYAKTPAGDDRKGLLNPFKKRGASDKSKLAQSGGALQAPDPAMNKETEKFIENFEKMKKDAIENGEYRGSTSGQSARGAGRAAPNNVPLNQINDELSRIDQDAQLRRDLAMRELSPSSNRPGARQGQGRRGPQNRQGNVEQVGDWQDGGPARGPQSQGMPNINSLQTQRPMRGAPGPGNGSYPPARGVPDQYEGPQGRNQDPQAAYPSPPSRGMDLRPGIDTAPGDPAMDQRWNGQPGSAVTQSWPDSRGGSNQFDAGGGNWDGNSVMPQDRVAPGTEQFGNGYESNPQLADAEAGYPDNRDPRRGNNGGRGLPVQPASNQGGTPVLSPPGWGRNRNNSQQGGANAYQGGYNNSADDGRNAAAQLGLDAGMGEMFPDSAMERPAPDNRRQGRAPYGPRNSNPNSQRNPSGRSNSNNAWPSVDPQQQSLQGSATTPGGLRQGGEGMMSPADYSPRPTGYRNGGYPQGATPGAGDNYGGTTDSTSAWGQNNGPNGSNPSNTVRPRRPNYNYQTLQDGSRNAQNQSNGDGGGNQNFGAPPMNFGR
jgi:tetratricopeptide (TPR) repeat protein